MEEKVIITFDGNGEIEIETNGIKGAGCEKTVDKILVGIGAETVNSRRTKEYFEDGDGDDPVRVLSEL